MATDRGFVRSGQGSAATAQGTCAHRRVQVSWADLMSLCASLVAQLQGTERPEVVVALARAGYVPGAILACLLRSDLVTLPVPPGTRSGRPPLAVSGIASLRLRLAGRRVLVVDETTHTGESLAWAARTAADAGALSVRTAALFLSPGSPPLDASLTAYGDVASGHVVQPWVPFCLETSTSAHPRRVDGEHRGD